MVAMVISRFTLRLAQGSARDALSRTVLRSTLRFEGGLRLVSVPRAAIGYSKTL